MTKRTKIADRTLPSYTKGEEIFNMVSHIVGAAMAVAILVLCIVQAAVNGNALGVITSIIYGVSMITLYCMSAIYHGLPKNNGKKVMQVLDHCTIYFLIAGTYTPIVLVGILPVHPVVAWITFGVVWGLAALATTLTAIDLKKFSVFSNICYIGMGWCIIVFIKPTLDAIGWNAFILTLAGGIAYTIGAVLYGIGTKVKWMHSIFHVFIIIGSLLQFFAIYFYVLPIE